MSISASDVVGLATLASLFAVANRFRGGGLGADRLPGHPRFYVAGVLAILMWLYFGWVGVVVAACFLIWSLPPHGEWYDLGRLPGPPASANEFERVINRLPNDHVRFTVRNLIGLIPAAVLISPLFLLLAPAQTAAYEAGWRMSPKTPTVTGEWITGALWGAFIWWLA